MPTLLRAMGKHRRRAVAQLVGERHDLALAACLAQQGQQRQADNSAEQASEKPA